MLKNLAFAIAIFFTTQCHALTWHWHDAFSNEEKSTLRQWVGESNDGVRALFGPLPYEPHIHLKRRDGAREPVPWANTRKYRNPEAHFHVDPAFSFQEFRSDWTAAHELSHLLFPYLGSSSRWFAEGIASYLQYQIMYASGVLSWNDAVDQMVIAFDRGRRDARAGNMPIPDISRMRVRAPKRLYWGGAAYFLAVDQKLGADSRRLHDVLRKYINCCWRMHQGNARSMIAQLDRLSGDTIFQDTYTELMTKRGFPDTGEAIAWLRKNPPALATPKPKSTSSSNFAIDT